MKYIQGNAPVIGIEVLGKVWDKIKSPHRHKYCLNDLVLTKIRQGSLNETWLLTGLPESNIANIEITGETPEDCVQTLEAAAKEL